MQAESLREPTMAYFDKQYHPPGTPPGTLREPEGIKKHPLRIHLVDYTETELTELTVESASQCLPYLSGPSVTWVHVLGYAEPELLTGLGDAFGLHRLALEDVMNTGQRPKTDAFDDQIFAAMSFIAAPTRGGAEQISLFLGPNFIVSFHNSALDVFAQVRKRVREKAGRLRAQGADYLFYALLDLIIDQAFPALEVLGDRIEALEEAIMEDTGLSAPDRSALAEVHDLRRSILLMRRAAWPHRDVISALLREESTLVSSGTKIYLRDCYDHAVHAIDLLETYRDTATNMMEVYLSSVSNRLNDVMRVLTIIATLFIPLTFITGIYGMNFVGNGASPWAMPELRWYYGYPIILFLMAVVAAGMLFYFHRKRWL